MHAKTRLNTMVLLLLGFISFGSFAASGRLASGDEPASAAKPKPQQTWISVSPETTRLMEPLTDEGYVDYLTAINERRNQVPPEDNSAVVLFAMANYPNSSKYDEQRQRLCELLGIESVQGWRLSRYEEFLQKASIGRDIDFLAARNLNDSLANGPWRSEQYPLCAEWLGANAEAIEQAEAMLQRGGTYLPVVPTGPGDALPFEEHKQLADGIRLLIYLLRCRINQDIGEQRFADAVDDLIMSLRICGLRYPLPSFGLELIHSHETEVLERALQHFVSDPQVDSVSLKRYLQFLNERASVWSVEDSAEFERYSALAMFQELAADTDSRKKVSVEGNKPYCLSAPNEEIDWNHLMNVVNRYFDHVEQIYAKDSIKQRLDALRELRPASIPEKKSYHFPEAVHFKVAAEKDEGAARKALAEDLFNVRKYFCYRSLEGISMKITNQVNADLTRVLLAARLFTADHKKMPDSVADLQPVLGSLPIDPYSNEPYRVRISGASIVVYSVGGNGIDDGGNVEDRRDWGFRLNLR